MGRNAEAITAEALSLDVDQRSELVSRLIESLNAEDDGDEAEVDAAWRDEIGSRVDDILSGKVEMIPYEESRRRLHARLAELRK